MLRTSTGAQSHPWHTSFGPPVEWGIDALPRAAQGFSKLIAGWKDEQIDRVSELGTEVLELRRGTATTSRGHEWFSDLSLPRLRKSRPWVGRLGRRVGSGESETLSAAAGGNRPRKAEQRDR